MLIRIEPLGCDCFLPAFVIGYELTETSPLDLELPQPIPPWLVVLDQQAGGLCMSYPSVIGAVLRWEANHNHGRQDLSPLIAGFKAMAEDPDIKHLRDSFPLLHHLVATHGEPYTSAELKALESLLASYLAIPPLEAGIEAFIRCAPCQIGEYFLGWNVMQCQLNQLATIYPPLYGNSQHTYSIDESNLPTLAINDRLSLDDTLIGQLESLGHHLATPSEPRVFLLWENSD